MKVQNPTFNLYFYNVVYSKITFQWASDYITNVTIVQQKTDTAGPCGHVAAATFAKDCVT